MNKENYLSLRAELAELGMFKPNALISMVVLTVETLLLAVLTYFLFMVEKFSIGFWLLELVLGLSMFRFFAILHESGHRAMFASRLANTLAGFYASLFCLIPYIPWRDIHFLHHKWVGVIDKDPTQAGLLRLKSSHKLKLNILRVVWRLYIPIPSIQLIFSVFWMYPFRLLKERKITEALKGFFSLALCLVLHGVVFAVLGAADYLSYVVPMLVLFFFWFEGINFTHHSELFPYISDTHPEPIPLHEQDAVSRTSAFSTVVSTIFAYNFNFHTEHHYFPIMPWHNLPTVYRKLKEFPLNDDYKDVAFLGFSVNLRAKDPVDVYVNSLLKSTK